MRQSTKQRGMASLITLMIVCTVFLILAGVMIPSVVETKKISDESMAAEALNQIGLAETTFAKTFSGVGYVPLQYLTGTLPTTAVPVSCMNSFILNGGQIQNPQGYTIVPSWGSAVTRQTGCPAGFSTYSLLLHVTNPLEAERSFYMAQDGIIHFNDTGVDAGPGDPVYNIAGLPSATQGNNSASSNGDGLVTIWSPGNYVAGDQVLRPQHIGSDTCNGSNLGYAGPFIALDNNSTDPCNSGVANGVTNYPDSADWWCACSVSWSGGPSSGFSGTVANVSVSNAGWFTQAITNPVVGPSPFSKVQFNTSGAPGNYMDVYIVDGAGNINVAQANGYTGGCGLNGSSPGGYWVCNINSGTTTGGIASGPMTINRGDALFLVVYAAGGPVNLASISYSISP